VLITAGLCPPGANALEVKSRDPYAGAIVIDARNGATVFEDHADRPGYPASMVKLMDLLIILEMVEDGKLSLKDKVLTTAESARMGGTQVFLKEGEEFPVEELLYAMIVRSANDAAVALAIHIAGSKRAFVELMNKRAEELGMESTEFHSVHGLPPGRGQKPDVSTARDMAKLSLAVVNQPGALKYTSTEFRKFRNGTFDMRTHNPVLGEFEGADGLKTGYFRAAGFSLSATSKRDGRRIIAVILGSKSKKVRNKRIKELLALGFAKAPPGNDTVDPVPVQDTPKKVVSVTEQSNPPESKRKKAEPQQQGKEGISWGMGIYGVLLMAVALIGILFVIRLFLRRRKGRSQFYHLPR
jgi:D-alanyl-D-alanine carboxypeptidase (penicillin-binding protein 5/6)